MCVALNGSSILGKKKGDEMEAAGVLERKRCNLLWDKSLHFQKCSSQFVKAIELAVNPSTDKEV